MSYQKLIIMGNIGKIEQRFSADGSSVVNFSVAVNDNYKKKDGTKVEDVEWFTCVSFGAQSEVIAQYFAKGSQIMLDGTLKTRKWKDVDGNTRYSTSVKVANFSFVDKKPESVAPQQQAPVQPKSTYYKPSSEPQEEFGAISDNIPFNSYQRELLS